MGIMDALSSALALHTQVAVANGLPYRPYACTAHIAAAADVRAAGYEPNESERVWVHIPDADGVRLYCVNLTGDCAGAWLMSVQPACSCKARRSGELRAWHQAEYTSSSANLVEVRG